MKKINRENIFLIGWLSCIMLLVGACNLGFIKETWSAFGNVTGQLTVPYTMNYYSNYPNELELESEQRTESVVGKTYTIMINVFNIDGYEFVNWNTSVDGTGDVYNPNDSIPLEKNLTLYAQWKKVEVIVISYGDVNLDNAINEDDFLLIEQSISSGNLLVGQSLLNADVNVDGNVDLVDADIIKQVCLDTEGYVGILPDKPILVYEVYKEDASDDTLEDDNTESDDKELEEGGESFGGSSSGSGTSNNDTSSGNSVASGNGSSGSGSGTASEKKPSSGGSSSNSGSNQDGVSSEEKNTDDIDNTVNDEEKVDDVLTESEENKENNYSNNDEYEEQQDKKSNNLYALIIVFGICLLSVRLIFHMVHKFNEKEKNIHNESDI